MSVLSFPGSSPNQATILPTVPVMTPANLPGREENHVTMPLMRSGMMEPPRRILYIHWKTLTTSLMPCITSVKPLRTALQSTCERLSRSVLISAPILPQSTLSKEFTIPDKAVPTLPQSTLVNPIAICSISLPTLPQSTFEIDVAIPEKNAPTLPQSILEIATRIRSRPAPMPPQSIRFTSAITFLTNVQKGSQLFGAP